MSAGELERPDTRYARNAGPTEVASGFGDLLLVRGEPRVEVDLPDAGARARRQLAAVQLSAVGGAVAVTVKTRNERVVGGGAPYPVGVL